MSQNKAERLKNQLKAQYPGLYFVVSPEIRKRISQLQLSEEEEDLIYQLISQLDDEEIDYYLKELEEEQLAQGKDGLASL